MPGRARRLAIAAAVVVVSSAITAGSALADSIGLPPTWASAYVGRLGFRVNGQRSWDYSSQLHVITATYKRSGDGYYTRAFIFIGSRYLGTDTKNPDAAVSFVWQQGLTFALRYPVYRASDPNCCPAGRATVRFHWTGSKLVPLDRIPPDSARR